MKKSWLASLMVIVLSVTVLAGCSNRSKDYSEGMSDEEKTAWETATSDPYGKYPELVTYTTGYCLTTQGGDALKGTAYEKDTTENNAYTRYLKEVLNIQNTNVFEAAVGNDYDQKVSMAIASQEIPDIMYVSDYATLVDLVENDMIEDMTDIYNNLACNTIKKAYESYGKENNPLNTVTFDGKIMAIPKTQLSDAQDFLWVRKDWLDNLGLKEPSTIDEMEVILKAFVGQDPDGDGKDDTIGLAVNSDVYGKYPNNTFAIDNIFTALNAYPNIWITSDDGNAVYGSIQPEMKDALVRLHNWYNEGIIDKQFATRTYDDNIALLSNGQCGAYIGPWWSPFIEGQTASYATDDAEWVNISCPVGADGKINAINTKSYGGFVVVRKGYEHPEVAMKIVNVTSEYSQEDTSKTAAEIIDNSALAYFNWPLYTVAQLGNTAAIMTEDIKAVLDGKADESSLSREELGYYQSIVKFMEAEKAGKKADAADYSQYKSRLVAINKIIEEPADFVTPAYFETTDSMKSMWASLEKIEIQTILEIIVGEEDISKFDQFVKD